MKQNILFKNEKGPFFSRQNSFFDNQDKLSNLLLNVNKLKLRVSFT